MACDEIKAECGMRNAGTRRGMTLMELLLVLALLVLFAALAAPSLRGVLEDRKLNIAADALRAAWAKARVEAMKTGYIQGFRFEHDGEHYRLEPYYGADESFETETIDRAELARSEYVVTGEEGDERLVEGIRFVAARQVTALRGQEAAEALSTEDDLSGREETTWSPPILFYPDGTCSEANVLLGNRNGRRIEVTLRALTGTSRAGEAFVEQP